MSGRMSCLLLGISGKNIELRWSLLLSISIFYVLICDLRYIIMINDAKY